MKRLFLPLLGFLSLVLMCCNDNKESGTDSYDPNKPVTIDYFTPDAPWNGGQSRSGRTRACPRCAPCHGAVLLHRSIVALRKECSATAHTPAARQGLLSCIGIPAGWCVANTTPACPVLLARLHPEYQLKCCTVVLSF